MLDNFGLCSRICIWSSLTNQARSADMAARNAEAGISFLQTAESVLLELANLNTRLRELAVQKASIGTLDTSDIAAIEAEENAIVIAHGREDDEDRALKNAAVHCFSSIAKLPETPMV